MEIERKFLVKELPNNIERYEKAYIEQGYLSFNPEVRVRNKNDNYYLTVKGNGTIAREEYETQISIETYMELAHKIQGKQLCKDRYKIPLDNRYMAELDIYRNFKEIRSMVEVEFPDIESANNFTIPNWFGKEVTNDDTFKNKNLAIIIQD